MLLVHFALSRDRRGEALIVAACGGVGLVVDSLQAATGRLVFADAPLPWLAPPWVVVLWLQLGSTLRGCLAWLSDRYGLAALFGLVGGPLAFLAGERLGAAVWGEPRWLTAAVLAVVWAGATPALVALSERLGAGRPRGYRSLTPRRIAALSP